MSEKPSEAGASTSDSPPPPEPADASPRAPVPSSPSAPDPEDWRSTGASGDDERYLTERPPHWE